MTNQGKSHTATRLDWKTFEYGNILLLFQSNVVFNFLLESSTHIENISTNFIVLNYIIVFTFQNLAIKPNIATKQKGLNLTIMYSK